ncbi:MAG: FHA domain-containing protein, partial [Lachnospiraceae bacterium]
PEEDVKEEAEEADEPEEDAKEEADEADEPEEDVIEETEDADDEVSDESQEIVNKIKEKISKNNKKSKNDNETEETEKDSKDKGAKKPAFKTKEASVGVVIQDDLDEFLAEKEMEEKMAHHEESSLKIKKNIKVSRASILKNTQEELKAAEETAADVEEEADAADQEEEEAVSNSILSQTINGATNILKGAAVPKVNPYLIRVNTDERIMVTKQNFKIGKASMGVDYTVKGNGAVSRVHAIITNKDGVYYIKDNKSTNHTFVNGKTVQDGESELLTHDSKIVLGDEEFVFKLR